MKTANSGKPLQPAAKRRTHIYALVVAVATIIIAGAKPAYRHWLAAQQYGPAPAGMVFVPPGNVWLGSDAPGAEPDERPARRAFVPGFYIDIYEVTHADYRRFDPEHVIPPGFDDYPVTAVLRRDAERYCDCLDRRLPTGAEWEKAARGVDGRTYPWGDTWEEGRANVRSAGAGQGRGKPQKVGSLPGGVSPFGCHDMSGNVWEWVSDDIVVTDSRFPSYRRGVLRGGAFNYSVFQARCAYQGFEDPNVTCNDVGFRCARSATR